MTKHIHTDYEHESPSLALLRQAGEANGHPRMMAYVAGLIAVRGRRPVVQPRFDGGPVQPGQVYTGNEQGPESVVTADGRSQSAALVPRDNPYGVNGPLRTLHVEYRMRKDGPLDSPPLPHSPTFEEVLKDRAGAVFHPRGLPPGLPFPMIHP